MIERHWVIDLSEARPGRWAAILLTVLGVILVSKFCPELWPVIIIVLPIAAVLYRDDGPRRPIWSIRKDRA